MPLTTDAVAEQYTTLIRAVCEISEAYYYLGRLGDAVNVLELASPLSEQAEVRPRDRATFLLQYGKQLVARYGQENSGFELAHLTLLRAQQTAEQAKDEEQIASALDLIGLAYYYQRLNADAGTFDTALDYFQQGLDRRSALADPRGMSQSLFHVGLIHQNTDRMDDGLDCFARAREIAERHGLKLEQSNAARHLAFMHELKGDLAAARRHYEESLALREEIGLKVFLPNANMAVGDICVAQNDMAAALRFYQKALALAEELNLKSQLIFALCSIGSWHQSQQDWAQARAFFERAYATAEAAGHSQGMTEASARLAELPPADAGAER